MSPDGRRQNGDDEVQEAPSASTGTIRSAGASSPGIPEIGRGLGFRNETVHDRLEIGFGVNRLVDGQLRVVGRAGRRGLAADRPGRAASRPWARRACRHAADRHRAGMKRRQARFEDPVAGLAELPQDFRFLGKSQPSSSSTSYGRRGGKRAGIGLDPLRRRRRPPHFPAARRRRRRCWRRTEGRTLP